MMNNSQIQRLDSFAERSSVSPRACIMADVRLGVGVAGLYTLVGMGLIIVFM
jgi:hypothetical protein